MDLSPFAHQSLFEATAHLFTQLGIRLNSPTAQPIPVSSTLGASYRDREPFKSIQEAFFVGMVDDGIFARQTDLFAGETNTLEAVQQRADRDDAYTGLMVFALDLSLTNPARTALAELARAFNRVSRKLPVAVVFRYKSLTGQTVLSLAAVERIRYAKGQQWRPGEKLGKVSILKDIDLNQPHSGHLRILRDLDLQKRTGKQVVTSFREFYKLWQETFSVSILNKRFYQELFHWYLWAVKTVKFPKPADESLTDEAYASASVIRLLTRLIFVWFVKEKGLISASLFDEKQLENLLLGADGKSLDVGSDTDGSYYQAILQNLFFATLNTPMNADAQSEAEKRQFVDAAKKGAKGYSDDYGDQTRYRYAELFGQPANALQLFAEVPFLNGGLFECLDRTANKDTGETERRYDGFTSTKSKRAIVPNALFFGQTTLDLAGEYNENKPRQTPVKGLIGILNSYKFTIAENTPLDEEIALDPELLGRVFENLLASYNPETKSTARKQTGSFYTPREIVAYMVDESLKAYLLQKLTAPIAITQTELGRKQTQLFGNEVKKGQLSMLETVATTPTMPEAEASQKLDALFDDAHEANPFSNDEATCTTLIDAIGAANILDPACGSGAFPMGILHRMVSLLSRLDPENKGWREVQKQKAIAETQKAFDEGDSKVREERLRQISEAFEHNSSDYGRKLFLIENCIYGVDIQQIAVQIAKLRFFISLIVEQKVDENRPNRNVLSMPNLETKFVAANTLVALDRPQGQLNLLSESPAVKKAEKELNELRQQIFFVRRYADKKKLQKDEARKRRDLQQVLERNGYPKGTASQMAGWNPFDAMHSAGFFDMITMYNFDPEDRFNIVIGNPPYLTKLADEKLKSYLKANYKTSQYQLDLYVAFIERSVNLLFNRGVLSFITPNSWLKNMQFSACRKFVLEKLQFEAIAPNLSSVFEQAVVDTLIFVAQRNDSTTRKALKVLVIEDENFHTKNTVSQSRFQSNERFVFDIEATKEDVGIVEKVKSKAIQLGSISEITRGVNPYDKYRGQSEEVIKTKAYHADFKKDDTFVPEIRGRHLHPYGYKWDGKSHISYGPWLAAARETKFFENERIVMRQVLAEKLVCAVVNEKIIIDQSIFIAIPTDNAYSANYLLGVLGSRLTSYYFKLTSNEYDDVFPKIKIGEFRELPIPKATSAQQAEIETLVNRILTAKKTNQDTTTLERQIDVLVYRLYGLTHAEVLVVEPGFGMAQAEYELVVV